MATTPAGNEYELAVYVDPFPGRKGSERIQETCGKCGGHKVISWGNVTLKANGVDGRVCFECMGRGYTSRLVSSARQTARNQVKAENERRAAAADFAADFDAQQARDLEDAHTEALAEQARRDALPKGFLGQSGERLRNLNARVVFVRTYESADYMTGRPVLKCIIKFDVLGRTAVAFTSHSHNLEDGQFVNLTGTVKDHNTRDGEDQTVLSRIIVK